MTTKPNRFAAAILAIVLVIGAFAIGGTALGQVDDADPQETTYLRVAHASPDAPPVDVLVENETVLSNVTFGTVSDYLELPAGTYNVSIAAANDSDAVVSDGNVTLDARSVTTLAATGEVSEDAETNFEPVAFTDDAFTPADNESAIRVVHLSPDAPTVDVTAANGSVVLADNVSYQNASEYVTVPAGNYTVEIRNATAADNGSIVTTANVSLDGGTAHSALAVGYLDSDAAPADTPFEVVATEDASLTVHLPGDEMTATETPTATEAPAETPTETMTETPTMTETMTDTPAETETETVTETP